MHQYLLFENLPWQAQQWATIYKLRQYRQLPHALLLSGPKGLGKLSFALQLARDLLCTNSTTDGSTSACLQCTSCDLFQTGNHPDLMLIQAEPQITIDKIRSLVEASYKTAHQEGYKIFILEPTEAMNNASANALLKTLEEPPSEKTLIQLVTHQPSLLMKTIISRCFQIKFSVPQSAATMNWLQSKLKETPHLELLYALSYGSPLQALSLAEANIQEKSLKLLVDIFNLYNKKEDPILLASQWSKENLSQFITMCHFWLEQISKIKNGIVPAFLDSRELLYLAEITTFDSLFQLREQLLEWQRQLANKINLNTQLLMEAFFSYWCELYNK